MLVGKFEIGKITLGPWRYVPTSLNPQDLNEKPIRLLRQIPIDSRLTHLLCAWRACKEDHRDRGKQKKEVPNLFCMVRSSLLKAKGRTLSPFWTQKRRDFSGIGFPDWSTKISKVKGCQRLGSVMKGFPGSPGSIGKLKGT